MDPAVLANPQWSELGDLLTSLWIMVALVVSFATNMLVANNWIPSFVQTRHLSPSLSKARPIFYLLAACSFGGAIYMLSRVVDHAGVLRDFWPNYWI